MARLDDVLTTLGNGIKAAISGLEGATFINQKNVEVAIQNGQIIRGNPLITEVGNILAAGDGNWQIQLWPLKAKVFSPLPPTENWVANLPTSPLLAAVTTSTITFSLTGAIGSPINVHTVFGDLADAYVQAVVGDTPTSVAAKVAAAINALALDGISATAAAGVVSVTSNVSFLCNVGASGTIAYPVGRFQRGVQISVWASDPYTRSMLEEAIEENVGTSFNTFLLLPDGTALRVINDGVGWDDDSQSAGSLFLGHLVYTVIYTIMLTSPATPVGAIKLLTSGPRDTSGTVYVGGPS